MFACDIEGTEASVVVKDGVESHYALVKFFRPGEIVNVEAGLLQVGKARHTPIFARGSIRTSRLSWVRPGPLALRVDKPRKRRLQLMSRR